MDPPSPPHVLDPDGTVSPAEAGASQAPLFGVPWDPLTAAVCVVPVPFDATCSYRRSAAQGPAAVLRASSQVDLFDPAFGSPWKSGIHMEAPDGEIELLNREGRSLADRLRTNPAGDKPALRERLNAIGAEVNRLVAARAAAALGAGRVPVILGGDHSTAFGAVAAAADAHPGRQRNATPEGYSCRVPLTTVITHSLSAPWSMM